MIKISQDYIDTHQSFKKTSRGFKLICPECDGKDLWYTPDNGRGYCFECGSSFMNEDFSFNDANPFEHKKVNKAPITIRSLYTKLSRVYYEYLSDTHRNFLYKKGLVDSEIDEFMLGYCPDHKLPLYDDELSAVSGLLDWEGRPVLSNRIVIPYLQEDEVTDLRGRSLNLEDPLRYKGLRYDSHSRHAIFPFNYSKAMQRYSQYLLLTEGEFKAIIGHRFGFPCVALPGITNWKVGIDTSLTIIVVFDSESTLNAKRRVDRSIANIALKVPDLFVVNLPLRGKRKQGLDDFLLDSDDNYFELVRLIEHAIPYSIYRSLRSF